MFSAKEFERVAASMERDGEPYWESDKDIILEALRLAANSGWQPNEKVVAWGRGVHSPSTPNGPAEYDLDLVADEDQPEGEGWFPLYRRPVSGWRDMAEAPRDGTRILIWFVHQNAKYAADPIKEGWAAAHEAQWIDHNGGGWTWHGLCGVATYWQPLPAPPQEE